MTLQNARCKGEDISYHIIRWLPFRIFSCQDNTYTECS